MIQIRAHLYMFEPEEFHFSERCPMQVLKESCVLVLNRGQKFLAAQRMGRGNSLINQPRAKSVIDRLTVSQSHGRTQLLQAAELRGDTKSAAMPHTRLAFIDPYYADHRILHSRDKRFADNRDCSLVESIPIRAVEDPLFLAKNRSPQRPIAGQFVLGRSEER